MIVFPNCKINLGLRITSKRADGFHNLETVFYPLPWQDALEVMKAKQDSFTITGVSIPGKTNDNICLKAVTLLKQDFPQIEFLNIHLHKTIPTGAGLGGGSADGAFMLTLLNKLFHLQLTEQQLLNYSLRLGSDCPFFIINQPCLATGRGEMLKKISLDLGNYSILIVNPGIHINTGWAFTQITPGQPTAPTPEILQEPINAWRNSLVNDFEAPVFQKYPEIGELKERMYKSGALFAAMTGTGSSVFGLFAKDKLPLLSVPEGYTFQKII